MISLYSYNVVQVKLTQEGGGGGKDRGERGARTGERGEQGQGRGMLMISLYSYNVG